MNTTVKREQEIRSIHVRVVEYAPKKFVVHTWDKKNNVQDILDGGRKVGYYKTAKGAFNLANNLMDAMRHTKGTSGPYLLSTWGGVHYFDGSRTWGENL